MKTLIKKLSLRQKRIWRIRKKVSGTANRPRLCVTFSNKHVYAQAIDDTTGTTLVGVSSLCKELLEDKVGANRTGAVRVAKLFAEKAKAADLDQFVFDRHGRPYHGRIKDFAECVRETGLKI